MILSFVLYASFLLIIVFVTAKKKSTEADFVIGSRSLNFWVTAISAHASDMSSWLFLAYPMIVFTKGLQEAWIGLGLVLGMFLNWHFVAPKLRIATEKLGALTLSSYLQKRYDDKTGFIRVLTALICLVFFTFYISSGLQGIGYIFSISFQTSYEWGVFLGLFVAILYTITGGFITVAWTDFYQGIFLVLMILLVPLVAFIKMGGVQAINFGAKTLGVSTQLFPNSGILGWVSIILFILSWGPGYFGQPHILTKFMGIKKPQELYKSKYLGITWQVIALSGAVFVGLISIGFFPRGIENPQLIFPEMAKALFHPFIAGFVLCGIFAATLSTIESQILVQASLLSEDFYKPLIRPKASSKELLLTSRICVILVASISFCIAFFKISTIYELVMYSWSGLGAAFGPIILLSLYSKKITREGAIAAIMIGGICSGIWKAINSMFNFAIPELIPAFTLSLVSAWIFSNIGQKKI